MIMVLSPSWCYGVGLLDDGHDFQLQQHAVLQLMDRDVARRKLEALGQGAALARQRYA